MLARDAGALRLLAAIEVMRERAPSRIHLCWHTVETLAGHAFISYVREDSHDVDNLQRTLEAIGVRVWRDTADLWPGENWRLKIRHAITESALVFLACFSSQSIARAKSYQNEELLLAIEQLRMRTADIPWLIPVRFDDCVVPDLDIGGGRTLASIQRADLFGTNRDIEIARLVATMIRILGPMTTNVEKERSTNVVSNVERSVEDAESISNKAYFGWRPRPRWGTVRNYVEVANDEGGIDIACRFIFDDGADSVPIIFHSAVPSPEIAEYARGIFTNDDELSIKVGAQGMLRAEEHFNRLNSMEPGKRALMFLESSDIHELCGWAWTREYLLVKAARGLLE